MTFQQKLSIRMDDVLQNRLFTKDQKKSLEEKSMFEWFLEADKIFEKYNYPCVLAVLADGLENNVWVDYIKENQHRYIIELHGSSHYKYGRFSPTDLYEDLFRAKNEIEDMFSCKISTWYVPFGRKCRNPNAELVCEKLGIKLGIPNRKVDAKLWFKDKTLKQVNFHYWKNSQNLDVKKILDELHK